MGHCCIHLHAVVEQQPLPGSIWLSTMSFENGRKSAAATISMTQPNHSSAHSSMRNEFVSVIRLSGSLVRSYPASALMQLHSAWLRSSCCDRRRAKESRRSTTTSQNMFTVLIYLTPTLSTAIPTLPMEEMRHCFTEGEKRPSAAALKFLSRGKFQSERVAAGDMLTLNCAVPHYGVANPDEHDRFVLFLLFFPSSSPTPDTEEQRYPHGVKD